MQDTIQLLIGLMPKVIQLKSHVGLLRCLGFNVSVQGGGFAPPSRLMQQGPGDRATKRAIGIQQPQHP